MKIESRESVLLICRGVRSLMGEVAHTEHSSRPKQRRVLQAIGPLVVLIMCTEREIESEDDTYRNCAVLESLRVIRELIDSYPSQNMEVRFTDDQVAVIYDNLMYDEYDIYESVRLCEESVLGTA